MNKITRRHAFFICFFLSGFLLIPCTGNSQEMLKNPGFEDWIGEALDYIDVWTSDAATKETAITRGPHSQAAVRIEGLPQEFRNRLSQTVETRFTPGEEYQFTIWYNVLTSINGQDIKIASGWYDADGNPIDHETELLNNGEKFTSVNGWTEKSFRLTSPANAAAFIFRVVTQNGATVIYDDFSFRKLTQTPEITITPRQLSRFITRPGIAVDSEKLQVKGLYLTHEISLQTDGPDASLFTVSPAIIENTAGETEVTVTYHPLTTGEHQATLTLSSDGALPVTVPLSGICTGQPLITVSPAQPDTFRTKTGTTTTQTVYITASNLTDYIYASFENNDNYSFRISSTIFPKNAEASPLVITYHPETEGTHTADILLKSQGAEAVRIRLPGFSEATETAWLENFETGSKDDETREYVTCAKGSWEFAGALLGKQSGYDRFNGNQAPRLIKNQGYVGMDFDLPDGINTIVLSHASCESQHDGRWQLQLSDDFGQHWTAIGDEQVVPSFSDGLQPVSFDIRQKGMLRIRILKTGGEENESAFNIDDIKITPYPGTPDGDLFRLDSSSPQPVLNESFDRLRHNKPFLADGWRNVVIQGERPWWGYLFQDPQTDIVTESAAKATAFVYNSEKTDPYEMWLVTPALDYKNARNRIFTFRVMGDLMYEGHEALLELYYMEPADSIPYYEKIEMDIPRIPDDNGVWREFHVNLEGLDLADTFFMGFRFFSPSGKNHSVTYYIDDVTYGKTDLPVLNTDVRTLTLTCEAYRSVSSEKIEISSVNLTEPVTITVEGANKSRFRPSVETLPAEGGQLYVTFSPLEEGLHEAYLKISSRGAADLLIPLSGMATTPIPRILVAEKDRTLELIARGDDDVTSAPVIVNPFLLTEDISLNLEGPDAARFSLSQHSISSTGINETFTITYHPAENGIHRGIVRLSSAGVDDVTIQVTGRQEGTATITGSERPVTVENRRGELTVTGEKISRIEMYGLTGSRLQTIVPQGIRTVLHTPCSGTCHFLKIYSSAGITIYKILPNY